MKLPNICKTSRINIAVIIALVAAISAGQSHASATHNSIETTTSSASTAAAKEYQVGSMYVQEYKNPKAKGAEIESGNLHVLMKTRTQFK